ncbi:TPA: hypothetical protein ACGN8S_005496 [Bacillus cereus]
MVQNLKSWWSRWKRFWSQDNYVKETWRILIDLGTTKTMWCIMTAGLVLYYWGYDTHYVNEAGFFSKILVKVSIMIAIFIWIGVTYGIIRCYVLWKKKR